MYIILIYIINCLKKLFFVVSEKKSFLLLNAQLLQDLD